MLPTKTAVKIDDPETRFHGETGFILYNARSGVVKPCQDCQTIEECRVTDCQNGEKLPNGWYVVVFDPMSANGYAHCKEWVKEENIVINGC
jgi:hypothetical protein